MGRGVYHVLNRGLDRRWLLADDAAKQCLVELLARLLPAGEVQIYHWVPIGDADFAPYVRVTAGRAATRGGGCPRRQVGND